MTLSASLLNIAVLGNACLLISLICVLVRVNTVPVLEKYS